MAGAAAEDLDDPVVQGALRATAEVPALAGVWSTAPGQALARIHLLAAKNLAEATDHPAGAVEALGRPRAGIDQARFDQLLRLASAPTKAPAVVVAALIHGELATIAPFGLADGVTARIAERVVLVARGVDTKAVSVPEAGHVKLARAYRPLLEAYATGTPDGVGAWVRHCCEAYARGGEEGIAICRSLA